MICESCSKEEHRRAPSTGHDVDMEERGHVRVPSDGTSSIVVTLYQCPSCKAVQLESEIQ